MSDSITFAKEPTTVERYIENEIRIPQKIEKVREIANRYLSRARPDPATALIFENILKILDETGDRNEQRKRYQ